MTHLSGWLLLAAVQSVMPDTITLRGTIVASGTSAPLPFSIVELVPARGQRFTDQNGAFAFVDLAAGTYRLRVRQIGYRPRDTTFTLEARTPAIRIALLRIAIRLEAITVTGKASCVTPGPPNPAINSELRGVFDQLIENARRFTLLADSYPHRFSKQRSYAQLMRDRRLLPLRVDTLLHESWVRHPYQPGKVVGPPDWDNDRPVRLPILSDFADSVFVDTHCFWLVGRDTVEGGTYLRVDFAPHDSLRFPDVRGAAYLDSLTYQLQFTRIRVTHIEQLNRNTDWLEATSHFREVLPGIPLLDRVRSVQSFKRPRARQPIELLEEQRLLSVDFLRPVPSEQ